MEALNKLWAGVKEAAYRVARAVMTMGRAMGL